MTPDKGYFVSGVSRMTSISKTKAQVQELEIGLEIAVLFSPARSLVAQMRLAGDDPTHVTSMQGPPGGKIAPAVRPERKEEG
jgi:hypothetical protein